MLTKYFLLSAFFVAGIAATAQNEALSYVVLTNGETLNGAVAYKAPIMKSPFVQVNDAQLKPREVGLIRNNHGVFANVSQFNKGQETFAMRVRTGKVSVFERVDMRIYGEEVLPERLSANEEKMLLTQGRMDYLMDEVGNLYGTSYRELKDVFAYSDASLKHIKRMQRHRWVRGLLVGVGSTLTGVGIVQAGFGGGVTPALVMGVVGVGSNFLLAPAINDARWQALETYNREP